VTLEARPAPSRWRTPTLLVGWLALVAPFLAEAVGILRADGSWLIHRLPDDAFYYLEVARRMSRGDGSTFDGVHATNGYHPLWQWILVPLSWLFPGQSAFIKAALMVGLLFTLAAVLLVVRVVWRLAGPGPALVGAIIAVHGRSALAVGVNGMEGAAVILTLALLLTALVQWAEAAIDGRTDGRRGDRWAVLVGVASAAVVLARLDLVVVVWLVPVAMGWRRRSWRSVWVWLLGAAIAGGPFALGFVLRYQHVLTTSATIKQHELGIVLDQRYGGRFTSGFASYLRGLTDDYVRALLGPANATVVPTDSPLAGVTGVLVTGLGLAGMILGLVTRLRSSPKPAGQPANRALSPGAWGLALVAVMVTSKAGFGWVFAAWLRNRPRPAGLAALGVVGMVVLVVACIPLNTRRAAITAQERPIPGAWQDQLDRAGTWIRDSGPEGRYGAPDAGLLGYRLDGRSDVVNLDGLVNNYEFAALVNGGASLSERARVTGVSFLVARLPDSVRRDQFGCATTLWTSPEAIPYADGLDGASSTAPVVVLDLRSCR
jgi:hypothetical protein